jgi:hypothetical protein
MICPVCNALSLLAVSCPQCGAAAEDEGRWSDWSGPYAPYVPNLSSEADVIDAEADLICRHAVRCAQCQLSFTAEITAWNV